MNDQDSYDGSYAANSRAPVPNPHGQIAESTGHITSDSLAAESLRGSDSGFASDALHSGRVVASSVGSGSTTANVDDTSSATTLPAARDARARLGEMGEQYRTPADEDQLSGSARAGSGAYDTSRGGPQESYGGTAPRAAYSNDDQIDGNPGPKGQNISEGGFNSEDAPNASFNTNIGSKNDPGRVATDRFERANARSGADAGYDGVNQDRNFGNNQGGFENLGGETDA